MTFLTLVLASLREVIGHLQVKARKSHSITKRQGYARNGLVRAPSDFADQAPALAGFHISTACGPERLPDGYAWRVSLPRFPENVRSSDSYFVGFGQRFDRSLRKPATSL